MKQAALLIAGLLACTAAARADTLVKADGTRLTGSVQGVTFLTERAHGLYPRGLILALHVGAEGKGKDK
ncbi:hypothetical protein HQ576_15985, partial [bacterium]|nr:hypothetical protein [bacterium]